MLIDTQYLSRIGAYCAVTGGILRVVTAFIPFVPDSIALELVYALIDVLLMIGLQALYLGNVEKLGLSGLLAFLLAMIGLASIVGPDADFHGINMYQLGVFLILLGLCFLSVLLLSQRIYVSASRMWILTFFTTLAYVLFAIPELVVVSGVLFGLGFLLAGFEIIGSTSTIEGEQFQ